MGSSAQAASRRPFLCCTWVGGRTSPKTPPHIAGSHIYGDERVASPLGIVASTHLLPGVAVWHVGLGFCLPWLDCTLSPARETWVAVRRAMLPTKDRPVTQSIATPHTLADVLA